MEDELLEGINNTKGESVDDTKGLDEPLVEETEVEEPLQDEPLVEESLIEEPVIDEAVNEKSVIDDKELARQKARDRELREGNRNLSTKVLGMGAGFLLIVFFVLVTLNIAPKDTRLTEYESEGYEYTVEETIGEEVATDESGVELLDPEGAPILEPVTRVREVIKIGDISADDVDTDAVFGEAERAGDLESLPLLRGQSVSGDDESNEEETKVEESKKEESIVEESKADEE